jgi:hypothetical protein
LTACNSLIRACARFACLHFVARCGCEDIGRVRVVRAHELGGGRHGCTVLEIARGHLPKNRDSPGAGEDITPEELSPVNEVQRVVHVPRHALENPSRHHHAGKLAEPGAGGVPRRCAAASGPRSTSPGACGHCGFEARQRHSVTADLEPHVDRQRRGYARRVRYECCKLDSFRAAKLHLRAVAELAARGTYVSW